MVNFSVRDDDRTSEPEPFSRSCDVGDHGRGTVLQEFDDVCRRFGDQVLVGIIRLCRLRKNHAWLSDDYPRDSKMPMAYSFADA